MTHRAKTSENQVYVMGRDIRSELAATHLKHNARAKHLHKKGGADKDTADSVLRQQSLMFLLDARIY